MPISTAQKRWTNPDNSYDVNGDGVVSATDALEIINVLSRANPFIVDPHPTGNDALLAQVDVDADGQVSTADAFHVLLELVRQLDS